MLPVHFAYGALEIFQALIFSPTTFFKLAESGRYLTVGLVVVAAFSDSRGQANMPAGGIAGIAAREAQRREHNVKSAQTLFTAGSRAFADRSYGEAMDNFKAAFETMPPVPVVREQRLVFFDRYQEASFRFAQVLAEEARWQESETTLAAVIETADQNLLPKTVIDPELEKMLDELRSHDDRYNQALTPRHLRDVDIVEAKLALGRGYLNLGDYDRSERAYQQALLVDPYNTAARRGLESVERYRMNYYDAARDHTRAKMLAEVAAGWESPVPDINFADNIALMEGDVASGGEVAINRKLKEIIIPTIEFSNARLVDVLDFLGQKSQELDSSEADPAKRGVNIVVDTSGAPGGVDPSQSTLSVRLTNVPLGVALKYAAQQVDMKYRVDGFAVTVIPMSVDENAVMQSRTYQVPPGFLSAGGQGDAGASAVADPFAAPVDSGSTLVTRVTAQSYLEQFGVTFPPGSAANYNAATSILVVRNTPQQLETVDNIVRSAREDVAKNVQVTVKTISIEQVSLQQLGLDWLLGASNFGSTPRAFFAGGTNGNAEVPVDAADYPFVAGNGNIIGMNPVTSGLRIGNLATGQTIQDVINRDNPSVGSGRAPGVFAVSGVFTDPQFQAVIRALGQFKGEDQLEESHVVVKPGQIAKIENVRDFIYPTEYDPPELPNELGFIPLGGNVRLVVDVVDFPAVPAQPTAFETRGLGTSIEVEPTVAADNLTISLNVTLDVSEFTGFINYGEPILNSRLPLSDGSPSVVTSNRILMPVFDAVKETTNVTVWDGQTIAIGGFHGESIVDGEDKVPILGDLPFVGRGFRSSTDSRTKRALVIFVSVRLIDPGGQPINLPEEPELMTSRDVPPLDTAPVYAPAPLATSAK